MCRVFPQGSRKQDLELQQETCLPFRLPLSVDFLRELATVIQISVLLPHRVTSAVQGGRSTPLMKCQDRRTKGACPSTSDASHPRCFFLLYEEAKQSWKNLLSGSWCVCKWCLGLLLVQWFRRWNLRDLKVPWYQEYNFNFSNEIVFPIC